MALVIAGLIAIGMSFGAAPPPDYSDIRRLAHADLKRIDPTLHRLIVVVVEQPDEMMHSGLMAETTLGEHGECILHLTPSALRDYHDAVILHETLHCALDYSVLGPRGYSDGVTFGEAARREEVVRARVTEMMRGR